MTARLVTPDPAAARREELLAWIHAAEVQVWEITQRERQWRRELDALPWVEALDG